MTATENLSHQKRTKNGLYGSKGLYAFIVKLYERQGEEMRDTTTINSDEA